MWSETFDRRADDIFAMQEDIARSVASALGFTLPADGRMPLVKRGTASSEAYEHYLRGRLLWGKRTAEDMRAAIEYFQRAIELDSAYAGAYSGLADAYFHLAMWGPPTDADWQSHAQQLVSVALELDPTLGEAHASQGLLHFLAGDWRAAERSNWVAAALDPNYAYSATWNSYYLLNGHADVQRALPWAARAFELDPFSFIPVGNYGWTLYLAGELDRAIEVLERNARLNAENASTHVGLARAYVAAGRGDDAVAAALRATDQPDVDGVLLSRVAAVLALATRRPLGDLDLAYQLPEQGDWAFGDRSLLELDPLFEPVRADPRRLDLLAKIKNDLDVD
jgi:tetratricopeptide (TPR) repeat protein